jgi:two-component system chemotaxis response regulator CheB
MRKVRVLVVDDSVIYRSQIRNALANLPWIEVAGVASNGRLALNRIQLGDVDLVILDLEMPEMDGMELLREMKSRNLECPVLVFSSVSKRGAETTLEALGLGAIDFIPKPGADEGVLGPLHESDPAGRIKGLLLPKIMGLFPEMEKNALAHVSNHLSQEFEKVVMDRFQPKVIVIGASTGGPTVLESIFSRIAGPLRCPILVTQHMPPIFTATLAERIQKISGIPTFEAKHNQLIDPGSIYIAPGNFHMRIKNENGAMKTVLDQGPLENSVRPAVDPLFQSAAKLYGNGCLGIVLTGMGADGKVGAERIKQAGGAVLIQSEESCVVFGMPGAVMSAGAYDQILSPDQIVDLLRNKAVTENGLKLGRLYA